ncbi:MAG TPA: DOMON-like domain-containing protein [Burkholderiales bacterium]|nr:DOMON-like domain-containing protein [Burkholderiales bacterium]
MQRSARGIEVRYTLTGDLDRLRMPEPSLPRFADNLWQHTCFELFVRDERSDAYLEFNFAPSGEWAAYAFDAYREGMRRIDATPRIACSRSGDAFVLDAMVPAQMIAGADFALSAVVEELDGTLSYWALRHPSGKPDFHHRDAFALHLP